jgi:hypothetical protein
MEMQIQLEQIAVFLWAFGRDKMCVKTVKY